MKEGWVSRASWLNMLPCPGKVEYFEEYNIQNGNILEYLILEWRHFIGVFRSAIIWNPRTPLSQFELCIGKERVKIQSQSYRTFDIIFLLQLCTFGKKFSNLKCHEIIPNTNKIVFIHIESVSWIK